MKDNPRNGKHRTGGVTARAVILAMLLVPINVFLVVQWETVWGTQYPTTMSLYFNVVFCLFVVTAANAWLRRSRPAWALRTGELLAFYVVLTTAVGVSGHDFTQGLFCTLGVGEWYATPENEWQVLFGRYLKPWLAVRDRDALTGFFNGQSTLYEMRNLRAWLLPALSWTAFLTVIPFTMLCVNVLVRRQWIEREKLTYPIVELPYEMTREPASAFFGSRALWLGFAVGAGIDLVNGVNYLLPIVPKVPTRYDLTPLFTDQPWNSSGFVWLDTSPYAIGIAFAIPLDLLFSCWFFYLIWKAQRIGGAALGINIPGYPFEDQQLLGGYLAILAAILWQERRTFARVMRRAIGLRSDEDDSGEPMSYRTAVIGTVLGMAFVVTFLNRAGMSPWFAVGFIVIYLGISLAFTRMRAEIGPPLQGIHYSGPLQLLVAGFGSRGISRGTFAAAAPLWPFTKELRNNPMPVALENLKLASRADMDTRRLWKVIVLATFVGVAVTFWAFLDTNYRWGGVGAWRGVTAFNVVERWTTLPSGTDVRFLVTTGIGAAVTLANTILRLRFLWWPLHPLGYLLAGYYHWDRLWFPFLIAWAAKLTILRAGGIRGYRKALPFFLGMVLGEFVLASLWGIVGLLTSTRVYAFRDW